MTTQDTQHELTNEQLIDGLSGFHRSNFTRLEALVLAIARAAIAADRAINAADRDVMQQAPEGWKLVSVEPTDDMVGTLAIIEASMTIDGKPQLGMAGAEEAYEARLAAAPTPPAEQPATMVNMGPPATSRDRWMYEQGRLAERDPRTPPAEQRGYTDGGRNMFYEGRFEGETERQQSARLRWADDMRAAFERHTGNGWFDKDWHIETALWAACWNACSSTPHPTAEQQEGFAQVVKEDANNYCLILRELGMEEEGDPVTEVRRLKCLAEQQGRQKPVIYTRSEFTKGWTTFNVRRECADAAEVRLKGPDVLAALRAKVEALPHVRWERENYWKSSDVLAEIDKLGGKV